jgi:hypothetical protein
MIDKNTPAFPVPEYEGHNGERAFRSPVQEGMTYRQWLIGMALQGLVSSNFYDRYSLRSSSQQPIVQVAASIAVEYADAIIERLNKEDKQ